MTYGLCCGESSTWMYVLAIPIRLNPTCCNASTILYRFSTSLQRMSTARPNVCDDVPLRPCAFSYSGVRYALFKTNGMPAMSRAVSNRFIVPCAISCNEHGGVHRLNSDSLKCFAVIIVYSFTVPSTKSGNPSSTTLPLLPINAGCNL